MFASNGNQSSYRTYPMNSVLENKRSTTSLFHRSDFIHISLRLLLNLMSKKRLGCVRLEQQKSTSFCVLQPDPSVLELRKLQLHRAFERGKRTFWLPRISSCTKMKPLLVSLNAPNRSFAQLHETGSYMRSRNNANSLSLSRTVLFLSDLTSL